MDFNTFVKTKKLVLSNPPEDVNGYGVHHDWHIEEMLDTGKFYVCGEEFHNEEDAERRLFSMYQDELMLTEGY